MKTQTWIAVVISMLAVMCSLGATAEGVKPLKVLIVSGGCCHDYEKQKVILAEGIGARAKVEFDVFQESKSKSHRNSAYAKKDWWKGYDAVIHNECYGDVKDVAFIEAITQAHEEGLAGVTVHCSTHSYRHSSTDEWRMFLGVTSMGHGPKSGIKVVIKKNNHPIMKGIESFTTKEGELYHITKVWPNTTVLADGVRTKDGHTEPLMWVNTFGKGKMFGTTLGHHNSTMLMDDYLTIVTRGLMWACGQLNDDGSIKNAYKASAAK